MQQFQVEFLEFVIKNEILKFGEFTLKSGRVSPYFFNAGLFNTGEKIAFLAQSYGAAIAASKVDFDVLFGPAYKGIPLAATTAMALASDHSIDKPFCFNRKEAKDHGEGGSMVGAAIKGNVAIIDDVITAGTAIRESFTLIKAFNAVPSAVFLALDRQEVGQVDGKPTDFSAIQQVEQEFSIPVVAIATMSNLIEFLKSEPDMIVNLDAMREYRDQYGIR